ncbi:MAG TPA: DNA-3-methyladenine glycosylase 2 family protein [Usitatibacteraceae bacterium]|nr:DNA-3-methyladenine glycosylase 2 family protein [Usitatibacteraceae bacterium]
MKPAWWDEAKVALAKRDRVLRRLVRDYPDASLRTRGDAFQTLARSIVGQQISVKAAQAVWDRLVATAGRVAPAALVALDEEAMRAAGLSRMKVAYLKDLAGRFHEGELKPRRWSRMDDEAVIADLVRVKGIGRWSVEMFLIFHLMRPDVLPVGDLGLQRAMERLYNGGDALTKDDMREIAGPWRPFASAATWYLWRSLDPIPVEY